MNAARPDEDRRAAFARAAAALLAVDPHGLGGVWLKAPAGPVREAWLARLHASLPAATPVVAIPSHAGAARLLGEVDLAATLAGGRPLFEAGLLARADGGIAELRSAERVEAQVAAILSAALDRGMVAVERDGFTAAPACRFGLIALDEGTDDDPAPSQALQERLGLRVDLAGLGMDCGDDPACPQAVADARARLPAIAAGPDMVEALVRAAEVLGVGSDRAAILAVRAARAAAALAGRHAVAAEDAELAAALVLGPRATRRPAEEPEAEAPPPPEEAESTHAEAAPPPPEGAGQVEDRVLEAAKALLPRDLLESLTGQDLARRKAPPAAGRKNRNERPATRGRQIGSAAGDPRRGPRLDIIATLRAALPWQRIRAGGAASGLRFRAADLRVRRHRARQGCTTIFCVDASGSAALERLAEAKGAVEQLLAACYIRRDEVALVAFRGRDAEIVVPPTRSLQRARSRLAGLPGGGGTPLAEGIATACRMARETGMRGRTPTLVVITDGRSNVGFGGVAGRARATADALSAAREVGAHRIRALVIDSSSRPEPQARALATTMGALYLPLPHADAATLCGAVQAGAGQLMAVRP
jgi:magnesium chelatase subunit D